MISSQVADALMTNRPSLFNEPFWLAVFPPLGLFRDAALDRTAQLIMQQMVQIPRLVLLVRAYSANPFDVNRQVEILELIRHLREHDLQIESDLETLMSGKDGTKLEPYTWIESAPDLVPSKAYRFPSIQLFNLAVRHWLTRVLLCGMIETVHSVYFRDSGCCTPLFPQPFSLFALPTIQSQDVEAATNIAMCLPYAFDVFAQRSPRAPVYQKQASASRDPLPLLPLRLLLSLQISFGSWHRLEKRLVKSISQAPSEAGPRNVELLQAQKTKIWVIQHVNHIQSLWNFQHSTYESMERKMEILAGGRYEEWMARKQRVAEAVGLMEDLRLQEVL